MAGRCPNDVELAQDVRRAVVGRARGASLLDSVEPRPPLEWFEAAHLFEVVYVSLQRFAALFDRLTTDEIAANADDPQRRRDRPGQAWNFLGALFNQGPYGLSGVAAFLYEAVLAKAHLADAERQLEGNGLHKGVEWNNLGVARLALQDYEGALEAILNAAAEDRRTRPGQPSFAQTQVLAEAALTPGLDTLELCTAVALPAGQGQLWIRGDDVRSFWRSLDQTEQVYLAGAVRKGWRSESETDLGAIGRLTALREVTMLLESRVRQHLVAAGCQAAQNETLGRLLPHFAKSCGCSKRAWWKAVAGATIYHRASSAHELDCRTYGLLRDDLGLGSEREALFARAMLMGWLLRNFSNHQFELSARVLREPSWFRTPFAHLLCSLVISHMMTLGADLVGP
jgi:hypothetical protein